MGTINHIINKTSKRITNYSLWRLYIGNFRIFLLIAAFVGSAAQLIIITKDNKIIMDNTLLRIVFMPDPLSHKPPLQTVYAPIGFSLLRRSCSRQNRHLLSGVRYAHFEGLLHGDNLLNKE